MGTGQRWAAVSAAFLFSCTGSEIPSGPPAIASDVPAEVSHDKNLADLPASGPRWPALQTSVEQWSLDYPDSTWKIISDETRKDEYGPATFKFGSQTLQVAVRKRGQQSWYHPKTSYKVKFPKGTKFEGARSYNLLAEWLDAGYLTDMFSYGLMNAAGATAPRARYVSLTVNGTFQGVYTIVENVDDGDFLGARNLDPYASVYRCGERDCELKITPPAPYQGPWEKKTNTTLPSDDLNGFLTNLSRVPEHELEGFLTRNLELDGYLKTFAVYILINMYGIDDSGSFLVHDFAKERWSYVPWDLNNCQMMFYRMDPPAQEPYWSRPIPIFTAYDKQSVGTYQWKQQKYGNAHMPFSVLSQRIWDNPGLRNRVLDQVETLLATAFSAEQANARIDAQWNLIKAEVERDPWVNAVNASLAARYLKEYVAKRTQYLSENLKQQRHTGEGGVVFNVLGAAGGTRHDETGAAAPFIELYNREATPIDLGGGSISNDLRKQLLYALPAGMVVPPRGKLVLWADGKPELGPTHLPFTIGDGGGELGLYDGTSLAGVRDITYFAPLKPGNEYGRTTDGAESWNWRSR